MFPSATQHGGRIFSSHWVDTRCHAKDAMSTGVDGEISPPGGGVEGGRVRCWFPCLEIPPRIRSVQWYRVVRPVLWRHPHNAGHAPRKWPEVRQIRAAR